MNSNSNILVSYTKQSIAVLVGKHCILSIQQCQMKINSVPEGVFQ